MSRKAIEAPSIIHANPLPSASMVGPMLETSVIPPFDPNTRDIPESVDAQIANLFTHINSILDVAEGTWDDIIKITFFVQNGDVRPSINGPWSQHFPDAETRPARHTQVVGGNGPAIAKCSFTAYIQQ